ncbi:F-box/LRR-repeat protein At4g14103 [Beta vulgaris subsp. vulgaris]|uniref:F-box/LRR-repeat protein At4g14103 n=1 Tax=Beta vulgaris subsp. vulgaris TaxID=3555 RepID=UPI0020370D06|nr:F-box/LRR-repeat protein At4g14103 [Beta vulgaris subsp. vulgaris]XP_048490884.1 F-box/LRR-repeat protein At4g14103 [Beta vulgaris subsp. vulgaris]
MGFCDATKPRKLTKDNDGLAILIEDRISSLPDVLLAEILSLLSTKDAVATSVLSTRWRYAYTWVASLDFDDSPISHCVQYPHMKDIFPVFKIFVDKVLEAFQSSENISTFRLHFGRSKCCDKLSRCEKHCFPDVEPVNLSTWLCFPLTHGVRKLDICAHVREPHALPSAIFTCQTLEVLKLNVNLDLELPLSLCLPNLKECHLTLKEFPTDKSVLSSLVSSCPSLEQLDLLGIWLPIYTIKIRSTSLRRLSLRNYLWECPRQKVVLDVPNLEYLLYDEVASWNLTSHFSALVEAQVNISCPPTCQDEVESVLSLVSPLANVQRLYLMRGCVEVLSLSNFEHQLPNFHNLRHLQLGCEYHVYWYKMLMELLRCAPLLEILTFTEGIIDHVLRYEAEEYPEMSKLECESWSGSQIIPSCLRSHLKRIVINDYEGTKWELEMVKYFLKNASVLEELVVTCHESMAMADRISLGSTFQKLSRASMACSVKAE